MKLRRSPFNHAPQCGMSRVGPKYKSMVQGSDMRHKNSWVASLLLCSAAALTLSACGDSSTNKVAEQIKTSYEFNGKQVEMVGYLKTTRFTMVRNGVAPVVLVPTMVNDATSATLENIMLKFGKEPNSIYSLSVTRARILKSATPQARSTASTPSSRLPVRWSTTRPKKSQSPSPRQVRWCLRCKERATKRPRPSTRSASKKVMSTTIATRSRMWC